MTDYPDHLTVREGRARYFEAGGLPADGGYAAKWVRLQAGPVPLGFPNSDARRRAVKLHDIHHVLTGYGTTWAGEAEISAWELASGCGPHVAAWVINTGGLMMGLLVSPRRTYRAFLRGRGARNLYHGPGFGEPLLDEKLGDLRARLAFDTFEMPARPPGLRDRLAWLLWCGAAVAYGAAMLALLVAPVVAALRWLS